MTQFIQRYGTEAKCYRAERVNSNPTHGARFLRNNLGHSGVDRGGDEA
jgi:hypothetical protein